MSKRRTQIDVDFLSRGNQVRLRPREVLFFLSLTHDTHHRGKSLRVSSEIERRFGSVEATALEGSDAASLVPSMPPRRETEIDRKLSLRACADVGKPAK